jgi:hypothetical protein
MADEITVSGYLKIDSPAYDLLEAMERTGLRFDLSGTEFVHSIQSIGTSEEAIALGDVATPGWFFCVNLDDTNYVELRPGSGAADFARLNPGEFCVLRLAADVTLYAIANTAAVRVEYLLAEA